MKVTTLANVKGSLPKHDANLEADIVANRNGGTDRWIADIVKGGTPVEIVIEDDMPPVFIVGCEPYAVKYYGDENGNVVRQD